MTGARFTGSSIGAYVGLVPCEYSSGASRVQGSITKAGNAHVRRLLIEAAWHHRAAYRNPGPTTRARWAKVDPAFKDRGHAGNRRLHQQWCRFNERKKPHVVANVGIARQSGLRPVTGHAAVAHHSADLIGVSRSAAR